MSETGDDEDYQVFEMEAESENPPSEFCLLLWASNGGQVGSKGKPIFNSLSKSNGYCDKPFDCASCPLMQQELSKHPDGHIMWVCPACLKEAISIAKEKDVFYHIPAHYTEGLCEFPGCSRPAYGDMPPKYSPLLQLFIGSI
jgi:hypothetical protein